MAKTLKNVRGRPRREAELVTVGVCVPRKIFDEIEQRRGDIPRSVYVERIVTQAVNRT